MIATLAYRLPEEREEHAAALAGADAPLPPPTSAAELARAAGERLRA